MEYMETLHPIFAFFCESKTIIKIYFKKGIKNKGKKEKKE